MEATDVTGAGILLAANSIIAVSISFIALLLAFLTYRARALQDSREEERNARRVAEKVSAWWGATASQEVGVSISNASDAPIYQVYVTMLSVDEVTPESKYYWPVLPPFESTCFVRYPEHSMVEPLSERVILSFTDPQGVRWVRDQFGRLKEGSPKIRIDIDARRAKDLWSLEQYFVAAYAAEIEYITVPDGHPVAEVRNRIVESAKAPPDMISCPSDWIEKFISDELIVPVNLPPLHSQQFPRWALEALTVNQRLYGIPTTVDTVALIRNIDLVPELPPTFQQCLDMAHELCAVGVCSQLFALRTCGSSPFGDPFQMWPLFAGAGGSLFAKGVTGPTCDDDVQLDSPPSIRALDYLIELCGVPYSGLRRGVAREDAIEMFVTARTPFLFSTFDALEACVDSPIKFSVSEVPPLLAGRKAEGFGVVHCLAATRFGENVRLATEMFADYLARPQLAFGGTRSLNGPIASAHSEAKYFENTSDPASVWYRLARDAVLAQGSAQADDVWSILASLQWDMMTMERSASDIAHEASEQIRKLFLSS